VKLLAGAALALAVTSAGTFAAPIHNLSFDISGIGGYSVNTPGANPINGDIAANTTQKILPSMELISEVLSTSGDVATSGISVGDDVTFSSLVLDTTVGSDEFTVSVGNLTFTFTAVASSHIVPTGLASEGSISEQFDGTVTGATGLASIFLGQDVSLSEACTQSGAIATINCSESVVAPGLPVSSPEPASLALLGVGVFGLGLLGRRQRS
jgi:hypothetical protein